MFQAEMEDLPAERIAQFAFVTERCATMGWEIPRLLSALEKAVDFYLNPVAQSKMPRWSKGRVVLVGDASYCPLPFSGQGGSLAQVGAFVLAWHIGQFSGDHAAARAGYEAMMRPFVEANLGLADLSRDPRFTASPEYYTDVIEPAEARAENFIDLPGIPELCTAESRMLSYDARCIVD
jgi:2-polyprenyl-6-methoxyphenol hydroxylase-like FAD-dependent oxidoreductase